MRSRTILVGALALIASGAHADFIMTFDQPTMTTVLPSDTVELIFTGTITKDEMGSGQWSVSFGFAGLPSDTDYLDYFIDFTPVQQWLATNDSLYEGELFRILVHPTNQIGLHNYNSGAPGNLPYYKIGYTGITGNTYDTGLVPYAVNILPVPEPATLSILALGGLALLRRRKKA
jgi:hypothetical protein